MPELIVVGAIFVLLFAFVIVLLWKWDTEMTFRKAFVATSYVEARMAEKAAELQRVFDEVVAAQANYARGDDYDIRLQRLQIQVGAAKTLFWVDARLAARLGGVPLRKSYRDYLPQTGSATT